MLVSSVSDRYLSDIQFRLACDVLVSFYQFAYSKLSGENVSWVIVALEENGKIVGCRRILLEDVVQRSDAGVVVE